MESESTSSSRPSWNLADHLSRSCKLRDVLPVSFYHRSTVQVAQDLLGKVLVVRSRPNYELTDPRAHVSAGRIVETEAYHGEDPASHSARGPTARCSVMFESPGRAYVYFIYGMHEMLNFVTEREGYPGAVLIRALEPLYGETLMRRRRGGIPRLQWTNGPGKLASALGINRSHNRAPLQGPAIFVLDDGYPVPRVRSSGRIGISSAQEVPWRFFVEGSPFVSSGRGSSQ